MRKSRSSANRCVTKNQRRDIQICNQKEAGRFTAANWAGEAASETNQPRQARLAG
jgi:hypothetical protein